MTDKKNMPDERLKGVEAFSDPERLMPDPRRRKAALQAETREPRPELTVVQGNIPDVAIKAIEEEAKKAPQIKSTKADKYRR